MSKLRTLRTGLNLVIVILLTLLGRHFYDGFHKTQLMKAIVSDCGLPFPPQELEILHATRDGNDVAFSVTGPVPEFDAWLGEVDKWQKKKPFQVLNFTIRESEGAIRMDFSAELRK